MSVRSETYTDEMILAALSRNGAGEDEAIRYLYRTHFGLLSQYILNNSGSAADAEDIFQEVIIGFINLVKGGKFRGEASVKTMLYALNRNLWLNELKRRCRAQKREEQFDTGTRSIEQSVQQAMEYRQSTTELMRVVEQLGANCKKILLLYYYENRSMKEIVSLVDYENEQVVRNKKYKCLKRLEQLVQSNPSLYQQLKTILHG